MRIPGIRNCRTSVESIFHSRPSGKCAELTLAILGEKSKNGIENSKLSYVRELRNWRVQRYLLRLFGFILFDIALCALIIGLNTDGDYWSGGVAIVRMLELGFVAIGGGLIGGFISWDVDMPVRRCSQLMNLESTPILAAAASMDFWDTFLGAVTRTKAAKSLETMIKKKVEDGLHQELYPYSKTLLRLMLRTRDTGLVVAIVSWAAIAQPINGKRAVRRLEKSFWIRDDANLHKHVWRCLNMLNEPGDNVAPSLILLRGSQRSTDQLLLRAAAANATMNQDEMLRAADVNADRP